MAIIGPLPNDILAGQLVSAAPVMANYNWLLTQVNSNAMPFAATGPSGNVLTSTGLVWISAAPASAGDGLPLANTSQLYGGTGVVGVAQAVTIGTNLSFSGTVLNASGSGAFPVGAVRPVPTVLGQTFIDTTMGPYGQPIWCGQVSPVIWINSAGVSV